jgi:hypothetical protein
MSEEKMDALIVRHLYDLEAASQRLTKYIQIQVGSAIDEIIKEWAEEQRWSFDLNFEEDATWLANECWRIPELERSKNEFYARFATDINDAGEKDGDWNSEFWLTQLCGFGPGAAGFRWSCNYSRIGAHKGAWKRFLRENEFPQTLTKLGLDYEETSGDFFIRFLINNETLATAIEGENIEDALDPVRDALSVIDKTWRDFDGLLQSAKKHFVGPRDKLREVPPGSE